MYKTRQINRDCQSHGTSHCGQICRASLPSQLGNVNPHHHHHYHHIIISGLMFPAGWAEKPFRSGHSGLCHVTGSPCRSAWFYTQAPIPLGPRRDNHFMEAARSPPSSTPSSTPRSPPRSLPRSLPRSPPRSLPRSPPRSLQDPKLCLLSV